MSEWTKDDAGAMESLAGMRIQALDEIRDLCSGPGEPDGATATRLANLFLAIEQAFALLRIARALEAQRGEGET